MNQTGWRRSAQKDYAPRTLLVALEHVPSTDFVLTPDGHDSTWIGTDDAG
jgi:hypothetical protein